MRMCCLRLHSGIPLRRSAALPQANMQETLHICRTSRTRPHGSAVRSHTPAPHCCSRQEPTRRAAVQTCKERLHQCCAHAQSSDRITAESAVEPEANTEGMSAWLDGLKWDAGGLIAVIAQASLKFLWRTQFYRAAAPLVTNTVDTNIDRHMLAV